jgi:hypothetical protein
MSPRVQHSWRYLCLLGSTLLLLNCSSSSSSKTGTAGKSGSAGSGSGQAGSTGAAGAGSGQAGSTGAAGAGSGQAGSTGAAGAGSGQAGNMGVAGAGSGQAGSTGAAGAAGGSTGAAGNPTGAGGGVATGVAGMQGNSVTTRNGHETRDGFFIQPTLTKAKAATMALDAGFAATFSGGMWANPLYLENGPGGKGAFIAATQSDVVYALDETMGTTLWMHSIGTAPGTGYAGCGNDTGITGTPVIDVASRTIYVAGVVMGAGGANHEIHALSIDDGTEKTGWPISVSSLKGGGTLAFDPQIHNQRGALSLVNGILYVPYGGHVADCKPYHGWVVAINASNPTMAAAWATGDTGSAIWAAGGMASNGDGVFATTGDGHAGNATHIDSEEVVHVTGMAQVTRATGIFFPTDWRSMDGGDLDFGAVSPVVITVPGSTPSTLVAATTKHGHFFLLNPAQLGNATTGGGSLVDLTIAGGGMSIRAAQAAYVSSTGVHVVMNASNTMCPMGTNGGVISVLVTAGNPPAAKVAWCAGGGQSPIATSTDGKSETIVWNYNNGLKGYDGDTGASVVSAMGNCGNVRNWTSPIAVKGRIVVGADGKLCSWSSH